MALKCSEISVELLCDRDEPHIRARAAAMTPAMISIKLPVLSPEFDEFLVLGDE